MIVLYRLPFWSVFGDEGVAFLAFFFFSWHGDFGWVGGI